MVPGLNPFLYTILVVRVLNWKYNGLTDFTDAIPRWDSIRLNQIITTGIVYNKGLESGTRFKSFLIYNPCS